MIKDGWVSLIRAFDDRRDLYIAADKNAAILFALNQFISIAQESIKLRGKFFVALSGGSTPNAIYQKLSTDPYRKQLDWSKVFLFWSDERSVPIDHPESNYKAAMDAGLSSLPIPGENIFRMKAEGDIEEGARDYEEAIKKFVPEHKFDLMMLGMGEDGHTASLFPKTHGLHADGHLVIANYVPAKKTWRMSVTYDCIQTARHTSIYVLGASKADMVKRALSGAFEPDLIPIQKVGTPAHKALWVLDADSASQLT